MDDANNARLDASPGDASPGTMTDELPVEQAEHQEPEPQERESPDETCPDRDAPGRTSSETGSQEAGNEGAGAEQPCDPPEASRPEQNADGGDLTITNESVTEAILFASDGPLPAPKIAKLAGVGDAREVRKHVKTLNEKYAEAGMSFRIEPVAGGYQMFTLPAFDTWVRKLHKARSESKLSQAAMETLAIIAYKQPILRVNIESIRGVAAGEMVNRLREMGLVKIVGRAEELGRPMLYGTTRKFLEVFGLASLDDLPQVEELKPPGS